MSAAASARKKHLDKQGRLHPARLACAIAVVAYLVHINPPPWLPSPRDGQALAGCLSRRAMHDFSLAGKSGGARGDQHTEWRSRRKQGVVMEPLLCHSAPAPPRCSPSQGHPTLLDLVGLVGCQLFLPAASFHTVCPIHQASIRIHASQRTDTEKKCRRRRSWHTA